MATRGTPTKPEFPVLGDLLDEPSFDDERTRIEHVQDDAVVRGGSRDRASLIVLAGGVVGEVHALDVDVTVLGRGGEADIKVDDAGISRRHARVTRGPNGFVVEDLGSTNGTFVGDQPVKEPTPLRDGDRIGLGKTAVIKFTLQDELERTFHRQMYESSVRDPLTQVFNRKYLMERLASELSYARRHGKSLSLLVLDIDHFKKVNDSLGHLAGDAALRALAALLATQLRAEDVVARYGGEEFVLVARGISAPSTLSFAERIRRATEALVVPWEPEGFRLTVSIGVAFTADGTGFATPDEVIAAADQKMYAAKQAGRNRVVMEGPRPVPQKG